MAEENHVGMRSDAPRGDWVLYLWTVSAAFGTYFCMYAFRKPYTAATFSGTWLWGIDYKTILVTSQTIGYMLSKFIGIKIVSEMRPKWRARGILVLILLAEAALVLFGIVPAPYNLVALFLNGIPLGMVFGLVLGFLEGRRATEALTAGLCTSFILADGVTKSVGAFLLQQGITEKWMPAIAGFLFFPSVGLGVWMLSRVPPPTQVDVAQRSERQPLNQQERWTFLARYATGLVPLLVVYLLVTIIRSIRADFAPEIWQGLGYTGQPGIFARSELVVALGVLVVNGSSVLIRDNRTAFLTAIGVSIGGVLMIAAALGGLHTQHIGGFSFMALVGLGLYLPYVAVHTTIFERLIAMTRERGNIGFLMYVADAVGYLGYVAVMLGRGAFSHRDNVFSFFLVVSWSMVAVSIVCLIQCWYYFATRSNQLAAATAPAPPIAADVS
jgi:hypothetical protein